MPAAPAASAGEWYADGLRFSCTQCGNCCTGPPGYVWFTAEEGRRIAGLLGLTEAEFHRKHAREIDGRWSLNERKTEHGYDCAFLKRDEKAGTATCGIYDARPAQCRTWPFWPENLRTRRSWITTKRTTPCAGMDRGKLVPIEEIRILRDGAAKRDEG